MEETRTVQYMIDSYNLSKETYVFSEHNDILFRRLFIVLLKLLILVS